MSSDGFGALFEQIFANSPDLVWIASADLSSVYFLNDTVEEWVPFSREDLYEDPAVYLERVYEDDLADRRAHHERTIAQAEADEPPAEMQDVFRIWDRDDSIRWLEERLYPIVGADNDVRYWAGIVRDVTAERETREVLSVQTEQFKLLNQIIRHDIRNEINLGLDVLRKIERATDQPPDHFAKIGAVMERVVDLTETSRDMTEVIAELAGNSEAVALKPCLQREITSASMISEDVTIEIDGDIPDVEVRTTSLLSAVFRNVLKNAIQHNDADHPHIAISTDVREHVVLVQIADNGPGIPDESKETVFESGATLSSEGTGFGLALIETLLNQHGCGIYLTDNEPTGSVFSITLRRT